MSKLKSVSGEEYLRMRQELNEKDARINHLEDVNIGLCEDHNSALQQNARMREALEKIRDCDWVITLPNRMDAVRKIARTALCDPPPGKRMVRREVLADSFVTLSVIRHSETCELCPEILKQIDISIKAARAELERTKEV